MLALLLLLPALVLTSGGCKQRVAVATDPRLPQHAEPDPFDLEAWLEETRAPEYWERKAALWAIPLELPDRARMQARVAEMLADEAPEVRETAVGALVNLSGPELRNYLPQLLTLLDDQSKKVRAAGAEAIGRIGPPAGEAVPRLLELTTDLEWRVSRYSAQALLSINPPMLLNDVPRLIALLEDADERVRAGAARALGSVGPVPSPNAARRAVGWLDDELLTRFPVLPDPQELYPGQQREAGYPVLELDSRAAAAIAPLLAALDDSSPLVRRNAVLALGNFGRHASAAAPQLRARLQDQDELVRSFAADTLPEVGLPRELGTSELIARLQDADPWVQRAAAHALGELQPREALEPLLELVLAGTYSEDISKPNPSSAATRALTNYGEAAAPLLPRLLEVYAETTADLIEVSGEDLSSEDLDSLSEAELAAHFEAAATAGLAATYRRNRALEVLTAIGPAAAEIIPQVIAELEVNAWDAFSPRVLARLNPQGDEVWPVLIEQANIHEPRPPPDISGRRPPPADPYADAADPDRFDRRQHAAAVALGELRTRDPALTVALLQLLDEQPRIAFSLYPALVQRLEHSGVLPKLAEHLTMQQPNYALPLALELSRMEHTGSAAETELSELLDGHRSNPAAAIVLGSLRPDDSSRTALIDALDTDELQYSALACEQLARQGPAAAAAVPQLVALLENQDRFVFAVAALSQIQPAALEPYLNMITARLPWATEDWVSRMALALGHIGPAASSALPQLEVLTYNRNPEIAAAAALSMHRIAREPQHALESRQIFP